MRRRTTRQNSNIFHMLGKNQIVELREAFNIIDTNGDGIIDKADLEDFLNSIGSPFTEEEINIMIDEMGPSISFMTFITMVGERLSSIDSEKQIRQALMEFDEKGDGKIEEQVLRKWLKGEDGLTDKEIDILIKGCEENGQVDCNLLTSKIKYGEIINE
ncbi:Myosin regulatory light polypeptide 9 [Nosema bombycis CQ1]|uniref:Myosin regulatory light polypeptide 9 n=1 Tax=Nosema bombycis (strain CQ1 / CVCC 102059) TaxID=578461 RepID=R0MDK9_NOSB1|nr:Myosin regulatory light polypeptide 9 [Nosema bombycis CQ1]|eukprot:EOB12165.1 Myosin regulatory light polypeptide 9 [Nosema bombycis CQ1]